jgi:hypothetical protein
MKNSLNLNPFNFPQRINVSNSQKSRSVDFLLISKRDTNRYFSQTVKSFTRQDKIDKIESIRGEFDNRTQEIVRLRQEISNSVNNFFELDSTLPHTEADGLNNK